jgi:thiamine transport system permease protein
VLAHVFLNLPLATRMILQGWQAIPAERFRLAMALGMPPSAQFLHLEAPMLRSVLPGALATIFLLCLTSFAIALTLGGGPSASTIELSIYQALRFEFDLGRAALLAALQFALCAAVTLATLRLSTGAVFGPGLGRPLHIPTPQGWRRLVDGAVIVFSAPSSASRCAGCPDWPRCQQVSGPLSPDLWRWPLVRPCWPAPSP